MNKIYDIQDFMVTPEEISFMIKGENIRVPLEIPDQYYCKKRKKSI